MFYVVHKVGILQLYEHITKGINMPTLGDLQNVRVVQSPSARLQAIRTGNTATRPAGGGYMQQGIGGGLQLPQNFGGANAYNIQNMYAAQNNLAQYQRQQAAQNAYQNMQDQQQRQFSLSGGFDPGPTRQMTAVERGLKKGSDFTQGLVNMTGWDPSKGFTPGNILRFGASLPFQMAQGVTEGSEQLYEAATGRPLLQADSETGLIGTNTLDASQRAADIANAAINIGGLFTGGSARAIGTGANILSKGKAGARMAEGMFGRAMKSPVGQIGYDVAEEGGEEFVQQYLDDTRMKQLDEGTFGRAIEGAKWGALGGGMMSGGSLALNKALGKTRGANESATAQDGQSTAPVYGSANAQEINQYYTDVKRSGGDMTGMPKSARALTDMMGGNRRIAPGAASVKMNFSGQSSRDRSSIDVGSEELYAVWRDGLDSQQELASSMRCTIDELADAMVNFRVNGLDYGNRAEALQALKDSKLGENGRMVVGVGRNPDTKNGGFLMQVGRIYDGSGMNIHPWVAPIVGSDFDGDTATIYFNHNRTNFIGTPIQMMRNPEAVSKSKAAPEADWAFGFIDGNLHTDRSRVKRIITEAFYGSNVSEGVLDQIDDWTDEFITANETGSKSGYSNLFSKMESAISQDTGDAWSGSTIVNTMLNGFESNLETTVVEHYQTLEDMRKAQLEELLETTDDGMKVRKFFQDRGNVGERTVSEIVDYMGGVIYAITSSGNPIFRGYSLLKFDSKRHLDWVNALNDINEISKHEDVFSSLVRTTFRMAATGHSPLNAAEGLIEATIISRTLDAWGSKDIRSINDINEFIAIYKKNHDDMVDIYKGAHEKATQYGIQVPINEYLMKPFEGSDLNDPAIISHWLDSFGDTAAEIFFDESKLPTRFQGMTLLGLVDALVDEDGSIRAMLTMDDASVNSLVKMLVRARQTKNNGTRTSVRNLVSDSTTTAVLRGALEKTADGYKLKESRYQWAFFNYIDSLAQLLDPVIAIRAGLYGLEILNTKIGQMLVDPDADIRLNGLIGLSLNTQFEEIRELFYNDDAASKAQLERKLVIIERVSPIHAAIASEIRAGNIGLLDTFVDPNISFGAKERLVGVMKQNGMKESADILDALLTEDSSFAVSGLSNRVREARSSLEQAERDLCTSDMADVDALEKAFNRQAYGDSMFMEWFQNLLTRSVVRVDTDLLGHAAYAAQTIHTSQSEKGTNVEPAVQAYATITIAMKGGLTSYIDDIMSSPLNVIEMSDFASNGHLIAKILSDKDFRIRVVDSATGRSCFLDRATLIKSLDPEGNALDVDDNASLNPQIIFMLLKKYPQLAGWLTDKAAMPSSSESSEPSGRIAKVKSLNESFTDYAGGKRSTNGNADVQRQVDEIKSYIELKLFNKSWYKEALIRVVASTHDINGYVDQRQWRIWMQDAHEDFVKGILSKVVKGEMREDKMTAYKSAVIGGSAKKLENLFEEARIHFDILADSETGKVRMTESVMHSMADMALLKRTREILEDAGVGDLFDLIEPPSVSHTLSEEARTMAQQLRDSMITGIDEMVRTYQDLAAAMVYALDEDPVNTWKPNDHYAKELEAILENSPLSDSEKQQVLNAYREAASEGYSIFADLPTSVSEEIIPQSLVTFDNEEETKRKILEHIIKIREYDGSYIPRDGNGNVIINELPEKKKLDDIFKDRNLSALKEFRNNYNGIYFARLVTNATAPTGAIDVTSSNAIKAQAEYVDNIDQFMDEVVAGLEEDFGYTDYASQILQDRYSSYQMPVPDFFSKKAESMGNAVRIMDQSAFVPATVSMNGGMAKKMMGFGMLDRDTMSPVPPKVKTRDELVKLIQTNSRDKFALRIPGQSLEFSDLRPPEAILKEYDALAPEAQTTVEIVHFDPMDNPHGIYDSHTPLPWSLDPSRYKRASGILARIIDHSQEGMVLRAKKKVQKAAAIVVDRALSPVTSRSVDSSKFTDYSSAMSEMRSLLDDFREEFKTKLTEEFSKQDMQDALGYDDEQSLILAQLLTPGFIVTLNDGTQVVMDVSHVFINEQDFKARIDAITDGNLANISSVEILTVSPEEASSKIMRAVSDYEADTEEPSKTVTGRKQAAEKAMNNWDGYDINSLSVDEIMSSFRNVGYSRNVMLQSVDWRTPYQYAIDQIYGGNTGAFNSVIESYDRRLLKFYDKNSEIVRNGQAIADVVLGRYARTNPEYPITFLRTFVPEGYIRDSKYKDKDVWTVQSQSGDEDFIDEETGKPMSYWNAAGLVLDERQIDSAAHWANSTKSMLYIEKSVWTKIDNEGLYPYGDAVEKRAVSHNGTDYIIITPWLDAKHHGVYETDLRAGEQSLDSDDILGCLIDGKKVDGQTVYRYKLGDASCAATKALVNHIEQVTSTSAIKLSTIFGRENVSARQVSFVSREQAIQICNEYLADPENNTSIILEKDAQGHRPEQSAFENDLRTFVGHLESSSSELALRRKNVQGDYQIVGLIFDGSKYAPIYKPSGAPKDTRVIDLQFNDRTSELEIRYIGKAGWDTLDSVMKASLEGEAMKMMMHLLDNETIPTVDGISDIHMIVSSETEAGRIDGMEDNIRKKDVYYCMLKYVGSLLFEEDENNPGKYIWRKNLNLTDEQKRALLSGDRKTWRAVASGRIVLLDPDGDIGAKHKENVTSANRAIRQIAINCLRYNVDPISVFSTYRIRSKTMQVVQNADGSESIIFDALKNGSSTRYMMAFAGVRYQDMVNMYHFMNPTFIPEWGEKAEEHIMDTSGKTRVKFEDGQYEYAEVRWGVHAVIGDQSSTSTASGSAKYSPQHMYRRAADYGYLDSEWRDVVEYADFLLGRTDRIRTHVDNEVNRNLVRTVRDALDEDFDIERYTNGSWSQMQHEENKDRVKSHRTSIRKVLDDKGEIMSNPQDDPRIKEQLERAKSKFGFTGWTWAMFMHEVDRIQGYTYDVEEHHKVYASQVAESLRQMLDRIEEGKVPIGNQVVNGRTINDRYALSRLSKDELEWFWKVKSIRDNFGTFTAFKTAVEEQAKNDLEQLEYITDIVQKKALKLGFEVDSDHWGEYHATGYVANALYIDDIIHTDELVERAFGQRIAGPMVVMDIDRKTFKSLCERELQTLSDFRAMAEKTNRVKWVKVATDERGKRILKYKAEDGRVISATFNTLTETSKVMALLNPMVFISNVADRSVHQGIMHFALWLGNSFKIGPYAFKTQPPAAENINIAVNNQYALELYSAMRLAQLTGEGIEFLANLKTAEEIQHWKKNRLDSMSWSQRQRARIYDLQTGSDKLMKGQFRNFLYRFYQFAEATPGQEFWLERDEKTGLSLFERQLIQGENGEGAVKFLVEVLGGHQGKTPSLTIALQAMNSAQQGDMAQRNVFGMVLSEICRKSPVAKFIVTTCISRFPDYSFNVAGRMLNWVLPISSINYVFTERLAEYGHNKAAKAQSSEEGGYVDPHYEIAQVHRNLKEAMLVDITHLGVGAVAMILVGMSGGIEPPDDEKKWGNTDEWLVCGMRVGDAWWIEDILGIALPMAAFTKSAQLGKPRMDILTNGITNACCSNPIIKVADAVGWVSDPDGSLVSRYDKDYEQYKDAKGGPPSFTDWMQANSIGFGLNWISQFFTPSCIREWYQNSQQWERSYKRVYQTNPDGTLSEAGQQGYTEYMTYADAQIRRATRRNPFLGFLADLALHPTTGYMAGEMPMTVYTDDFQREAGDYWTINGLAPEEQQAKILEIICEIQSYDNMEDLARTGFYLDNETRAALGSTVWDVINEWDNWYYGLQEDGQLDYYTLGNGDFSTGQQMAASIKLEWKNQKQYWSDFYYDKVRNLPTSMTTYNRYNTTYEKDVYGDIYATGYRPQGVLPFVSAPGTATNPEGTAGYENDFMTPSAVTGLPLGQRALVPTESYGEAMPSLEAWSGDGNGSGYSKLYDSWYGSDGTTGEGSPGALSSGLANSGLPGSNETPSYSTGSGGSSGSGGSKKTTYSSSRRRSGGGGGSRRRSSGGGGGYSSGSPSIYARYQLPYAQEANVMGRVNHSRANFDYLRPSFETKGSRESYKREDI